MNVNAWLRRNARRFLGAFVAFIVCFGLFSIFAQSMMRRAALGKLFHDSNVIPAREVALVLGTSKTIGHHPNPFYEARLDAAAELYRAGKIRGIVVSGDNSTVSYNEPRDMRNDLVARGVPIQFITCDFAGLRTLDSVQRISRVFGQSRFIIVSQQFHVERALYLAQAAGLDAVGFAAADAPLLWRVRTEAREVLARDMAVLDVFLGRQPRHLGGPEMVGLAPKISAATPVTAAKAVR